MQAEPTKTPRTILHLDMDAFFAAVEQLDHPEYRGKPVVVGADPRGGHGRGVVSTASYEARKYGIHSAMPISQAYKRCPHAIFVGGNYRRYQDISRQVMAILLDFSPIIQQISIDEAFLDVTGSLHLLGTATAIARKIKERIRQEIGLTASIGIAANKFIAKVASDLQKPDGLTVCEAGREKEFLAPLPITCLWGVGKKTAEKLQSLGLRTIGDITMFPREQLLNMLGAWGLHLWRLANGIDNRPVQEYGPRKSISEETTFMQDIDDDAEVELTLFEIADRLSRSMRRQNLKGRTITLKLRFAGFETHTRSRTLSDYVNDADSLRSIAVEQYRSFARDGRRIRLVGISVSQLNTLGGEQMNLFGGEQAPRHEKLEKLVDELKSRFGEDAVTRGAFLRRAKDT